MATPNKEQIIFFLRRRLKDVEANVPDQHAMARAGVSYGDRKRLDDVAKKAAEEHALEAACLQAAINIVAASKP